MVSSGPREGTRECGCENPGAPGSHQRRLNTTSGRPGLASRNIGRSRSPAPPPGLPIEKSGPNNTQKNARYWHQDSDCGSNADIGNEKHLTESLGSVTLKVGSDRQPDWPLGFTRGASWRPSFIGARYRAGRYSLSCKAPVRVSRSTLPHPSSEYRHSDRVSDIRRTLRRPLPG